MSVSSFFLDPNNIATFIAFILIAAIVLKFRKRFIITSKVMFWYKAKERSNFLHRLASHTRLINVYAIVGIIVSIGAVVYALYRFSSYFQALIAAPKALLASAQILLPVSGVPYVLNIPIAYFLIALVVVATLHELSHGIVALSRKIRLKSVGFVLLLAFFPLGAFVEPRKKDYMKASRFDRLKVLAAGSFMNIILAIIFFVLVLLLAQIMLSNNLVSFPPLLLNIQSIYNGSPASLSGLTAGTNISLVNGRPITSVTQIATVIAATPTGQSVNFTSTQNKTFFIKPIYNASFTSSVNSSSHSYIGISGFFFYTRAPPITPLLSESINPALTFAVPNSGFLAQALFWIYGLLLWLVLLNLGLGILNALPIFYVTDGCKIFYELLGYVIKDKKRQWQVATLIIVVFSVLFLLLTPIGPLIFSYL